MTSYPVPTTVVFLLTVLAIVIVFPWAIGHAGRATAEPAGKRKQWIAAALLGILAWAALSASLAGSGVLGRFDLMPPPFMVLLVASTALTAVLAFSRVGARLIGGIGLSALIGYQAFRIPVELVLHSLYGAGVVPQQMTFEGRNFDIVAGITALALFLISRRWALNRWLVLVWNLAGLALLVNIVTVAVLSAPVPFRVFMNEPASVFVTTVPYIWLPAILVQAAWFGHLLVFRNLWRYRGQVSGGL
ncbi:MAG: hypothetical protein O7G32_02090 [SAR324 cluster bacterium]|nr:hypothetical protein [SAR324 cluster bacterium]